MANMIGFILLTVVCGVGGQLALKSGMTQVGSIGLDSLAQPVQLAIRVVGSPLVLLGLGLYVLGAVLWLTILSRIPLSFAYPMLALSYAITPVLAWLLLGESLPAIRWVGITIISLGVFLISRS